MSEVEIDDLLIVTDRHAEAVAALPVKVLDSMGTFPNGYGNKLVEYFASYEALKRDREIILRFHCAEDWYIPVKGDILRVKEMSNTAWTYDVTPRTH